jgi:hypothetical protein
MDANLLQERFSALAASDERTLMARFRETFEVVNAAIEAGVSHVKARDELAHLGLNLTLNTFNVFLWRVRKEKQNAATPSKDALPTSDPLKSIHSKAVIQKDRAGDKNLVATQKEGSVNKSSSPLLPEDWLTVELTPEQSRSLTPEQKQQRRKARDKLFHPSPYDKLTG